MSDEDIALDEKRVFEERRGTSVAFVASAIGLARVEISDDQIGRFGLVHRGESGSVAVDSHGETEAVAVDSRDGTTVAVATTEDVALGDGEAFDALAFGPAVAVSFASGMTSTEATALVATDGSGRVARYSTDGWATIATLDAAPTAMDGNLVATKEGVHRVDGDELATLDGIAEVTGPVGVRDVADPGPTDGAHALAATDRGVALFADGEWSIVVEGDATAVATSASRTVAVLDGSVVDGTMLDGSVVDGTVIDGSTLEGSASDWQSLDCPATAVVDVGVGRATYAITADGRLFVDPATAKDGADGWASRSLGLTDVDEIAVIEATE